MREAAKDVLVRWCVTAKATEILRLRLLHWTPQQHAPYRLNEHCIYSHHWTFGSGEAAPSSVSVGSGGSLVASKKIELHKSQSFWDFAIQFFMF